MIGIGITPSLLGALGIISQPTDILFTLPDGRQLTRELVKVLVRYRIAAKAPHFTPGPCPSGQSYCIRSTP